MQVNKEFFISLSEQKQQFIENAFVEVKTGEITVHEFLEKCMQILTDFEFKNLFMIEEKIEEPDVQKEFSQKSYYEEPVEEYAASDNNRVEINRHNLIDDSSYGQKPSQQSQNKKAQKNADDNIDDIIQYTGVNLKEENDIINKDIYTNYGDINSNMDLSTHTNPFEVLFNIKLFSKYINTCCANRKVKITEDGVNMIFLALYRKTMNLLEKMDEASRIRTDLGLNLYNFTIKNEHNRQMWYLNELEKIKFEKLNMQGEKDKRKKHIQEREDLVIKKKQSNTVAMAAMGVKQKSWMQTAEKVDEECKFDSIYSPVDDKTISGKNRIITHKDFLYVLERDKRYNKSIFLLSQYYKW